MRVLKRARASKAPKAENVAAWPAGDAWPAPPVPAPAHPWARSGPSPVDTWAPPATWWPETHETATAGAPSAAEPGIASTATIAERDEPAPTIPGSTLDAPDVRGETTGAAPATGDVVRVLHAVTALCDRVVDYIEADRAERRLVVDALTRISGALDRAPATAVADHAVTPPAVTPPAPEPRAPRDGERVLGGSMPATVDRVLDLRGQQTAVEVRCRFGGRWVDGFEIFDVITDEFGARYRLRRRVDGVVLPELFLATDVRHVETFEELSGPPQGRWKR